MNQETALLFGLGILLFWVLLIPEEYASVYTIAIPVPTTSTDNEIKINQLVTQASRWAVAATQDTNIFVKVLHANYANGYVMALTDNYSEEEILSASGVDVRELSKRIVQIQYEATVQMADTCPIGEPKDSFLARIAKEGGTGK